MSHKHYVINLKSYTIVGEYDTKEAADTAGKAVKGLAFDIITADAKDLAKRYKLEELLKLYKKLKGEEGKYETKALAADAVAELLESAAPAMAKIAMDAAAERKTKSDVKAAEKAAAKASKPEKPVRKIVWNTGTTEHGCRGDLALSLINFVKNSPTAVGLKEMYDHQKDSFKKPRQTVSTFLAQGMRRGIFIGSGVTPFPVPKAAPVPVVAPATPPAADTAPTTAA